MKQLGLDGRNLKIWRNSRTEGRSSSRERGEEACLFVFLGLGGYDYIITWMNFVLYELNSIVII